MSRSINKVILIGNVGADPEVKFTPQGTAVANFNVATNDRYKDKDGNWQDRTEWHRVTAWQRNAEIAGEYLKKGRPVYVEGKLQTRSWDDKATGEKKYSTEIVVTELVLLGGNGGGLTKDGGLTKEEGDGAYNAPSQTQTKITDDDLPF